MLGKLNRFTKKVADLPDRPNTQMSAAELKEWFDAAPEELRVFINKTLAQIDADFALKQELNNIVLGQIVDGSLTDIKMSNDPGQIKDRLAQQINELTNFKSEKGQLGGLATLGNDGSLVQKPYLIGSYTGDNNSSSSEPSATTTRTISLGFKPSATMVVCEDGFWNDYGWAGKNAIYSAFATSGIPAKAGQDYGGKSLEITNNGFQVMSMGTSLSSQAPDKPPYLNSSGRRYSYIAFK